MNSKAKGPGLKILLSKLLSVATGELPHIYSGLCPDSMEGPNVRDPDCPACRVLIEVDKFLAGDMALPAKVFDLVQALREVEGEIPCPSCKKPARTLEFYPGPGGYLCADCLSDAIMEE